MGKDMDFKTNFRIKAANEPVTLCITHSFWEPDLCFVIENNLIVCEHSSTGDRKVHIGELTQFLSHIQELSSTYNYFTFLLFLDGTGSTRPTVSSEIKRLQYYYDQFPLAKKTKDMIKNIAICEYKEISPPPPLICLDCIFKKSKSIKL